MKNLETLDSPGYSRRRSLKSFRRSYGRTQIAQVGSLVKKLAIHASDESRSVWPRG